MVIVDEIHRVPNLFSDLSGIIDRGRRKGLRTDRFLVLGSASGDLLRQSGESLAGRIACVELAPLDILQAGPGIYALAQCRVRGGFPDSFLARGSAVSFKVRQHFIRTYLERDVAAFGPRLPPASLERMWTMLAHRQGCILNASGLAPALGISCQTVTSYIDVLAGFLLVRRLLPLLANVGKLLVKSPKVYVGDCGLVHALLGIGGFDALSGHPVVGRNWEGFVIENLLSAAPERTLASYYRTAAGAGADLVLDLPNGQRWAVEAKRSLALSLTKGFHNARSDLSPERSFLVYPGNERYSRSSDIEVIGLRDLAAELASVPS